MVNLIRMWRFVRLVNKKNRAIGYKDQFLVGFYSDEEEHNKYVSQDECIQDFRVYSLKTNKRKYIAERTCKSALSNKYLKPHNNGPVLTLLEVNTKNGTGEDLIEWWIWGLVRMFISREWKLITIAFIVLGWIAGYLTAKYT